MGKPSERSLTDRPARSQAERNKEHTSFSEQHYKLLVEAMGAVAWVAPFDCDTFSYVNPEIESMLGYPRSRWMNENNFWKSVIHPDDKEYVERICEAAEERMADYEVAYRVLTQEGNVKHVRELVRVTYDEDDRAEKVGIMLDVTEQVKQKQELQQAYIRFTKAFHSCPIPASMSRLEDGVIVDVNESLLKASGYKKEELLGQSAAELGSWPRKRDRATIGRILKEGKNVHNLAVQMCDAQQLRRNVQISATSLKLQDEAVMLLMYVDISDHKKIQQQLKNANRELEMFMYKSSHNLKGPVASMKGLISLALHEVRDPLASAYLKLMEKSNFLLENTLEELLDITRIKQGALSVEKVEVNTMLESIQEKLRYLENSQNLNINLRIEPGVETIFTDANLLLSIFQNLIENCIKYCDKGKAQCTLTIKGKRTKDKNVSFLFIDNGLGIPADKLENIFDMFFRAHSQGEGTGLGLYIVKNSVEKLGGTIRATSEYGLGTTVYLDLPDLKKK